MAKPLPNSYPDVVDELYRRINGLENALRDVDRRVHNFDSVLPLSRVDPISYKNPYEGQRAIDPFDEQHMWYSNGLWRKAGGNPVFAIKVFEDDEPNIVKDRAFVLEIPEDLDGGKIVKAGAFITTAGGDQEIDIKHDGGGSILDSHITIPGGSLSSKDGHTAVCDTDVEWGDQFSIDTLEADGMGLGVWIMLINATVGGAIIKGEKGDPGGIGNFTGTYNNGTNYVPGDVVNYGGSSYVAITNVIGVTPGVTPGWETQWQLLFSNVATGSVGVTVHTGTYSIIPGIKGAQKMPFAGEITRAELVADQPGNIVLDVMKSDYASWPTATSITGGNPLTLAAAVKTTNSTLTGWTTGFLKDDYLVFDVVSISVISRITLSLEVTRA